MKGKKFLTILESIAIIVIGVLVAVYKEGAMDTYFGIMFVVAGSVLLLVELFALLKIKVLTLGGLFAGGALLVVGIGLLISKEAPLGLDFNWIIRVFVLLMIAAGGALLLYGVFTAIKFNAFLGAGQITIGFLFVLFGLLYAFVNEFKNAFWIVVGILVAVYGLYSLLFTLFNKDENKKPLDVIEQKQK